MAVGTYVMRLVYCHPDLRKISCLHQTLRQQLLGCMHECSCIDSSSDIVIAGTGSRSGQGTGPPNYQAKAKQTASNTIVGW